MVKKKRTGVPQQISAEILFKSNRTCCVCRDSRKPVQIHHIDGNPDNHELKNLATLCLECHNETLVSGGFDRKLDSDQIVLFRDDWQRLVAQQRAVIDLKKLDFAKSDRRLEIVTSEAEIYKENKEYFLLAVLYDSIGNKELRDKYIEIALKEQQTDETIIFLRCLQNKQELIPKEVIEREYKFYSREKDFLQRGRLNNHLGKYEEAAIDYIDGIYHAIHNKETIFSAAYYLKEFFDEKLHEQLFIIALKQAQEKDDLWWQVRALQELKWDDALVELLLKNSKRILKSDRIFLKILLAQAQGDIDREIELQKKMASFSSHVGYVRVKKVPSVKRKIGLTGKRKVKRAD